MTLNLVIPGRFTTPGLPKLNPIGFVDSFSRGNGAGLGYTENPSQKWNVPTQEAAPVAGGIINGSGYVQRLETAGPAFAYAESFTADGTVKADLVGLATGWQREFGLLFRYLNDRNYWRFYARDGAEYRISITAGGTTTVLWTSTGITPTPGDTLSVDLSGSSLKFYRNGSLLHSISDDRLSTATLHGWTGNQTTTEDRVDNYSVTL